MPEPHAKQLVVVRSDSCDDTARISLQCRASEVRNEPAESSDRCARRDTSGDDGADRADACTGDQHLTAAPPAELIAVAPRRELRAQRLTDANELRAVAKTSETDLIRRRAQPRASIQPLGVLDRLPPFLKWRQVPALACRTDDPQTSLRRVERESAADGEMLDRLVGSERTIAEKTRRVHRRDDLSLLTGLPPHQERHTES